MKIKFLAAIMALFALLLAEANIYKTKMGSTDVFVISVAKREVNSSVLLPKTPEEQEIIGQYKTPSNEQNVMLIKAPNYTLLIDTGLESSVPVLESALKDAGVSFADITHVLITHGHGDHVGGILDSNGNNRFPNAILLVDSKEYDFWNSSANDTARNAFTSFGKRIVFLEHNTNLFPQGTLHISTEPAYGHTPGHSIVRLSFEGQHIVFWADLLHNFEVQTRAPQISVTYDNNKEQAAATRARLLAQFRKDKTPVVGAHVPFTTPIVLE